jgi:poly(3-hydroxybutyrate) depolymerase
LHLKLRMRLKASNMGVSMMKLCPTWRVCAFLLAHPAAVLADHARVPVEPLAAYAKLDPTAITVSGISSGAFFAHQFHVAFSGLVKGAAMVAQGHSKNAACHEGDGVGAILAEVLAGFGD